MSVFTPEEIDYLREQTLGRLATVGPDGQPHVTPVTFHLDAEEDTVDVGGLFFGQTKKWRDAKGSPKVTLLVDDVLRNPRRPFPTRCLIASGVKPSSTTPAENSSTRGSRISPHSSSGSAPPGS